ncbi:MAG: hypothetical protein DI587_03550 [Variovorax paradoxus]|nr:MAG: hypothetical protein DI583_03550 [Variovorax paradoxus]PZQ15155.1 MAG: hypothetical protein DI587_03550 [Variovorax paradoxus]HVR52860.1 hypothetical protein [Pseudorhodoferax sp.]
MCPLSNVQATNLQLLYAIRVGLEHDPVDTCLKYRLHARQAARLRAIGPEELWTRVQAVGHTSLFFARNDLLDLLEEPAELVGTLAAARTPALPDEPTA